MQSFQVSQAQSSLDSWVNLDNNRFYSNFTEDYLGLSINKASVDLNIVKRYAKDAKRILEVGAGRGRIISCLLKNAPYAELFALERNVRQYTVLQSQYGHACHVLNQDIMSYQPCLSFDMIVLAGSTIVEFSKHEQQKLLRRLFRFLDHSGVLCVGVGSHSSNDFPLNLGSVKSCVNSFPLYRYIPSRDELIGVGLSVGFTDYQAIEYADLDQSVIMVFSKP